MQHNKVEAEHDQSITELYLRIWEKQQDMAISRWTIITFFMSVSFAIFGLSLQNPNPVPSGNIQRMAGLAIYWFSYFIYQRYSSWSRFLREWLRELENDLEPEFHLQAGWEAHNGRIKDVISINKLLLYFGIVYAIGVIVLW